MAFSPENFQEILVLAKGYQVHEHEPCLHIVKVE